VRAQKSAALVSNHPQNIGYGASIKSIFAKAR
jgi:hypothetical protein